MAEIRPNEVHTTQEAQELLKVSPSTMKRLLKRGLICANKVGGQYRILGKEILRIISPELEHQSIEACQKIEKRVVNTINRW